MRWWGCAVTVVRSPPDVGRVRRAARRSWGPGPSHPAGHPAAAAGPALLGSLLATPPALATLRRRGGATGGPRVGLLAAATTETTTGAAALGLGDLRRGVAQRRADLVDVELDDGALLALLGLVGPGLQATGDEDPRAPVERLGDVLRRVAPDRAAHEQGLAVLPLVGLPVERARRGGHGEVRDGGPGGGEPELGVGGEVADDGDDGLACHGRGAPSPVVPTVCGVDRELRRRGA